MNEITIWFLALSLSQGYIIYELIRLKKRIDVMAVTLKDVYASVTAESTQIDSVLALVSGLKDQLLAIGNLTPEQQTQIQAIMSAVEANKAKLDTALQANVVPTV